MNRPARDLVGYGATPPDPRWPDGKRVALNLVLNYEEGGESSPLEGDPASEAYLHEVVGATATVGRRNLNAESMFEFGSRAGFWRVHRLVTSFGFPLTVFGVGQALERNPEAGRAMADGGFFPARYQVGVQFNAPRSCRRQIVRSVPCFSGRAATRSTKRRS